MAPKLRVQGTQPENNAASVEDPEAALLKRVRANMEGHLKGRRLVALKLRQVEGRNIDGILKIEGAKGELQMVDFKATAGADGRLSSLEVGGRRIAQGSVRETKRER